jgi:hypothetical protein
MPSLNYTPTTFGVKGRREIASGVLEQQKLNTTALRRVIVVCIILYNNQTPWPEPASELYRPSDRRLSEKLVSTFADGRVSRSQRGGSPTAVISVFKTRASIFSFK